MGPLYRWRFVGACALAAAMVGCQSARMPVPEELSAAERMVVQGRQGWKVNEHLRFGEWEAAGVERSWVRGSDLRAMRLERNRRREQVAFTLRAAAGNVATARCHADLLIQGIELPAGVDLDPDDRSRLTCSFHPLGDGGRWRLDLAEERGRPLEGLLSAGGREITVTGTNRLEGGLSGAGFTTGFVFEREGRTLGAVEVLDGGAVWLHPGLEDAERAPLAAAAAAVLLVSELRDTVDEG